MILFHTDEKTGFIKSYFEYDFVNSNGTPNPEGAFLYVRDLWIHPTVKGTREILKYIGELAVTHSNNTTVKHIYWKRHKTGELRLSRSFSREQCEKKFIQFFRRAKCYNT